MLLNLGNRKHCKLTSAKLRNIKKRFFSKKKLQQIFVVWKNFGIVNFKCWVKTEIFINVEVMSEENIVYNALCLCSNSAYQLFT